MSRRFVALGVVVASLVLAACGSDGQRVADEPPASSEAPLTEVRQPAEPTPDAKAFLREEPVASDDPAMLAEQLAMAERAIRDRSVAGEELAWMARLQQLVYKRLVQRPELRAQVIATLPPEVQPAATRITNAAASLRSMISPGDRLPPWRIVPPAPAGDLMRYYVEAEADFGVGWQYLASIHLVETVMGRIRGTSVAGAQGPMQFIPPTWAAFGEGDINDTRDSIRAAARYLRASGAPGRMENAIFAYNPDRRYVDAVMGYAAVMSAEPDTFRGFHNWEVYYLTPGGDVHLPVGYLGE